MSYLPTSSLPACLLRQVLLDVPLSEALTAVAAKCRRDLPPGWAALGTVGVEGTLAPETRSVNRREFLRSCRSNGITKVVMAKGQFFTNDEERKESDDEEPPQEVEIARFETFVQAVDHLVRKKGSEVEEEPEEPEEPEPNVYFVEFYEVRGAPTAMSTDRPTHPNDLDCHRPASPSLLCFTGRLPQPLAPVEGGAG